LASLTEDYDDA